MSVCQLHSLQSWVVLKDDRFFHLALFSRCMLLFIECLNIPSHVAGFCVVQEVKWYAFLGIPKAVPITLLALFLETWYDAVPSCLS